MSEKNDGEGRELQERRVKHDNVPDFTSTTSSPETPFNDTADESSGSEKR